MLKYMHKTQKTQYKKKIHIQMVAHSGSDGCVVKEQG